MMTSMQEIRHDVKFIGMEVKHASTSAVERLEGFDARCSEAIELFRGIGRCCRHPNGVEPTIGKSLDEVS